MPSFAVPVRLKSARRVLLPTSAFALPPERDPGSFECYRKKSIEGAVYAMQLVAMRK